MHELAPTGFTVLDEQAGHLAADHEVPVLDVRHVEDCISALAEHDVELRLVPSLWPYMDAVTEHAPEHSGTRLRNAEPRPS